MLTDEAVTRRPNGGIALCHACQRQVYFKGGFLKLLVGKLRQNASRYGANKRENGEVWTPPAFIEAPSSDDEDAAYKAFLAIRWPDGKPTCPRCGGTESQMISTRSIWRCKDCQKQYSATSGTLFSSRKLSYVDMMKVLAKFTTGASGRAMAEAIGAQSQTGWMISQKMKELLK